MDRVPPEGRAAPRTGAGRFRPVVVSRAVPGGGGEPPGEDRATGGANLAESTGEAQRSAWWPVAGEHEHMTDREESRASVGEVTRLVERWEDLRRQGQKPCARELPGIGPELVREVEGRIKALEAARVPLGLDS